MRLKERPHPRSAPRFSSLSQSAPGLLPSHPGVRRYFQCLQKPGCFSRKSFCGKSPWFGLCLLKQTVGRKQGPWSSEAARGLRRHLLGCPRFFFSDPAILQGPSFSQSSEPWRSPPCRRRNPSICGSLRLGTLPLCPLRAACGCYHGNRMLGSMTQATRSINPDRRGSRSLCRELGLAWR